ncbi:adenylyltransferase/cytidyltransferase family protein [Candidatus Micrarchaeota archaeon]|nr:adenylyltransferase/cytidyltransferase family protein [Candidatus Micrarchaeota archaeon]
MQIIHIGHLFTLTEAKKHGDFLVVIVARDDMIRKKNRKPIHSQDLRAKMVESLKPVDCAILGIEEPAKTVEFLKPNAIVYGYDQKVFLSPPGVEIIKLEKHIQEEKYKTHKIIEQLGL